MIITVDGIYWKTYIQSMKISGFYKCMSNTQRIRILSLLEEGELCVCHLSEILGMDQVRLSKQLRYMKDQGVVKAERSAQWMIYRLAEPVKQLLSENLNCLRGPAGTDLPLSSDRGLRRNLFERVSLEGSTCSSEIRELIASNQPRFNG